MIKRFKEVSFLLVLPIIFGAMAAVFRAVAGPFWLATNLDPAYAYLVNSLYLLKGAPLYFTDHPGTPLEVLGAVIVKAFHPLAGAPEIIRAVVLNPEFYLGAIYAVLWLGFFASAVWVGYYAYRRSGRREYALFAQLPGFFYLLIEANRCFMATMPIIANVNAEPLLMTVMNLFFAAVLKLYFARDQQEILWGTAVLAFLCGLGEAVKFTFTPIWIIPLIIIPGWWRRGLFLFGAAALFLFFTLPIWGQYSKTFQWILANMSHTGNYGSGNIGFIDWSPYVKNLLALIKEQWLVFGLALGSLLWSGIERSRAGLYARAVSLVVLIYFFMVAKHFALPYFTAGFGVIGLLLVFTCEILPWPRAQVQRVASIAIVIVAIGGVILAGKLAFKVKHQAEGLLAFDQMVRSKYSGCQVLGFYRSSGKEMALQFGDYQSNMLGLGKELQEVYPGTFFYHRWGHTVRNYVASVRMSEVQKANPCVLFRGEGYDFSISPFEVEQVEAAPGEALFRLVKSTEDVALYSYLMAVQSQRKGDLKAAYLWAIKSKEFKMMPPGFIDEYLAGLQARISKKL